MKTIIRNLIIYTIISVIFLTAIVYIYDGNLEHYDIIIQGSLFFIFISAIMEKIMMYIYVKIRLHYALRVQLVILLSLGLFTFGVWITRPWLLVKMFNIPVFMMTIFPMFVTFGIVFEIYFQSKMKNYNDKLEELKIRKRNI